VCIQSAGNVQSKAVNRIGVFKGFKASPGNGRKRVNLIYYPSIAFLKLVCRHQLGTKHHMSAICVRPIGFNNSLLEEESLVEPGLGSRSKNKKYGSVD